MRDRTEQRLTSWRRGTRGVRRVRYRDPREVIRYEGDPPGDPNEVYVAVRGVRTLGDRPSQPCRLACPHLGDRRIGLCRDSSSHPRTTRHEPPAGRLQPTSVIGSSPELVRLISVAVRMRAPTFANCAR